MAVSPGGRPMDTSPFSASTDDNWVSRAGGLPSYARGVAHALLRTGRAKDESSAIRLALGAIQNWASGRTTNGKGHVHPAVQAAAAAALAEWEAKRLAARTSAHANDTKAVELAFNEALHPRVPAGGAGGGEFGTAAAKQSAPTNRQPVGRGETSQRVSDLQARLNALGAKPPLAVDGTFGPKTLAAVEAFQQAHGLKVDGMVGPKTTAALRAVATKKVAKKATAVKAKATAAKKTVAKTTVKAKSVAAPKVNKAKGTVTATINGKKVTMTLHQWHVLHVAQEKAAATKLAGDSAAVDLAVKTPAPERAAARKKLAKAGDALPDGSYIIPDVPYLKKAIRSVGRAPASKRPALKALIRKRARELGAMNEPGVKGTWAFQAANDTEGIELAMMTKTARVRGPGDVSCSRTASGEVTVTHKPTGMRIGKLTPAQNGGWQGTHATGKATPASGSMTGALSGLIGVHNKIAASMPDAMPMPEVQAHAQQLAAMELAGSFTPAVTSGDGPRVTTMGGAAKTAKTVSAPASGAPSAATIASWPAEVQLVYKKLLAKGFSPKQALAFAKRASAMHAKATAKAA